MKFWCFVYGDEIYVRYVLEWFDLVKVVVVVELVWFCRIRFVKDYGWVIIICMYDVNLGWWVDVRIVDEF